MSRSTRILGYVVIGLGLALLLGDSWRAFATVLLISAAVFPLVEFAVRKAWLPSDKN